MICVNKREIRIIGLRRSGIHPISDWIASQFKGRICFFNDINHNLDSTTYPKFSDNLPSLNHPERLKVFSNEDKDLMLTCFEDARLLQIKNFTLPESEFGRSLKIHNVIVLRDPYNTFASRLKIKRARPGNAFVKDFLLPDKHNKPFLPELWMRYAREYIGTTRHISDKTVINFNRWLVDGSYRKSIASEFNCELNDEFKDSVPAYGFGSSFDLQRFSGRAGEMNLLDRWREFAADPEFVNLVKDNSIVELASDIFGEEFKLIHNSLTEIIENM